MQFNNCDPFFFFSGKWCCICLGVGIDSEQKYNHGCDSNKNGKNSELLLTRKHLSSVEDVETLRSIIRYVYLILFLKLHHSAKLYLNFCPYLV